MPYAPGTQYRGDQALGAGISAAGANIRGFLEKYFEDKKKSKSEEDFLHGQALARYGGADYGGQDAVEGGTANGPAIAPPAARQDAVETGAGAGGAGVLGMFGNGKAGKVMSGADPLTLFGGGTYKKPPMPAAPVASEYYKSESKAFKGLQSFAEHEYGIPQEQTTAMSKDALKGFLVGLDQRRQAQGQEEDRAIKVQRAQSDEDLKGAQMKNYASLDQDRAARQAAEADQLRRDQAFEASMNPVPESGALNRFAMMADASTLAPGTLDRYAGAPQEQRDPNTQEILRSLMKYGPSDNRARYAKMLLDSQAQAAEEGPPKVTMLEGGDGNKIPFISWNRGHSGQIDPGYGAGLRSDAQQAALTARGEQRRTLSAGELMKSYEAELKGLDNVMSWAGTTPEQRAAHRIELQSKMEALRAGMAPAAPAPKAALEKPTAANEQADVTPAEYEKLKSGAKYWWKGVQVQKR